MDWSTTVCLVLSVVHLSCQDIVTVAPSESEPEVAHTVPESSYAPEGPQAKPTIRSLHVNSDIKYRYATTLVSSRVVNPNNQSGEASFTLTLPESAFISEFLMDVKGKVYNAYVKEKEEAKATYDQAVAAGQFAGHVALDARDSNQFTVSVNIEAHGKVTFNLTYEQLLTRNLGLYTNVININPQQIVEDMSVTVTIEEPTAIKNLEVPEIQMSNEAVPDKAKPNPLAKIEDKSAKQKIVTWAPTIEEQKSINSSGVSGQFMVSYDVDREQNTQQVLVDEGYFVHFFAPEDLPKLKKHVVFVLDYSGSMAGRKLEQLKDAMNKIFSDLGPKDFFSIVVFQSFVEAWSPRKGYTTSTGALNPWETQNIPDSYLNTTLDKDFVVEATPENVALARKYIANYSDLGATNIMGGLRTGLELVKIGAAEWINESDPPQAVVVFLTDGQPNVEETDPDKITEKTKELNANQCPIFSLAFGYGADFNFLRKLSLSNSGFARNIYEAADASQQLENFYKTIASPLFSNITFTYLPGQVDNSSSTKMNFPVFFHGSELVVAGKLSGQSVCASDKDKAPVPLGELSGTTANGFKSFPIVVDCVLVPDYSDRSNASHLEKTWAYLTIQQLLDKADSLDGGAEKNQTKNKALKLALQYSFVTPLTSLVVVKPNETESAVDTTKVQPGLTGSPGFGQVPLSGFGFASMAAYPAPPMAPMGGFAAPMGGFAASIAPSMVAQGAGGFGGAPPPPPSPPMIAPEAGGFPGVPVPPIAPTTTQGASGFASTSPPNAVSPGPTTGPVKKVPLSDITWLQPFLANSTNSGNVTVTVNGSELLLGLDETDQSFGACSVDNKSGECHHFKFCALNSFQNDVSEYIPYQCSIPSGFLGVCCPAMTS